MSLVNIEAVHMQVLRMLAKLEQPAGIELLSYKRDRSVSIQVISADQVQVKEKGFVEQEFILPRGEIPRTLKVLIKREFPRSRKLRLFKFAHPAELGRDRKVL